MFRPSLLILPLIAATCAPTTPPPPLSDAEISRAIRYLDTSVQPPSIAGGREFCGYFGVLPSGDFTASDPLPGGPDFCDLPGLPTNFQATASYHSHGRHDGISDGEVPSVDDILSDAAEGVWGFVATPGGRVWLIDGYDRSATLLCGPGCIRTDPGYREDPLDPVQPFYTLEDIRFRQGD